jgi:hypothetical protein
LNKLGIQNRCYAGLCQVGTCYEQTIGTATHAYCQCSPGYRGLTCNQRPYWFMFIYLFEYFYWIGYFTCTAQGLLPDTAQCAIGRYFYCSQIGAGKCLIKI